MDQERKDAFQEILKQYSGNYKKAVEVAKELGILDNASNAAPITQTTTSLIIPKIPTSKNQDLLSSDHAALLSNPLMQKLIKSQPSILTNLTELAPQTEDNSSTLNELQVFQGMLRERKEEIKLFKTFLESKNQKLSAIQELKDVVGQMKKEWKEDLKTATDQILSNQKMMMAELEALKSKGV